MQRSQAQDSSVEMNFRETLLGQSGAQATASAYPPVPPPSSGRDHPYQNSPPASPHEHSADSGSGGHVAAGMSYSLANDSGADDGLGDSRKGKRELSTSKRAAQNRAAQRAFRQRKEGYIRKMEEQIKDYEFMEKKYRELQEECYTLREEVMRLQSQLLSQPSGPVRRDPGHSEARASDASMTDGRYASGSRADRLKDGHAS